MTHWSVVYPWPMKSTIFLPINREYYRYSPKTRVALRCEVVGTRLRGWCVYGEDPLSYSFDLSCS